MKGKHIVIGITGGIAAYKSATLVRLLVKAGAEINERNKDGVTPLELAIENKLSL